MGIFNNRKNEEESAELKIYLEKFRNRKNEGDFKTAMEIALRINWNLVNDAQLFLDSVEVFEKMEDYTHAKKLYEDAYVRSKAKERILYPLCIVSIKAGAIEDGVLFYEEFCSAYPDDIRKNKLKYLILKYKKASPAQLLRILEDYFDNEGVDEEMMFELANIYASLDRIQDCVNVCDKLVMYYDVFDYNKENKNPEIIDSQGIRDAIKDLSDSQKEEIEVKKQEDTKEKIRQDRDMGESFQASNDDVNKFDEIGGAFLDEKDHFEHITLSDLRNDDTEKKAEENRFRTFGEESAATALREEANEEEIKTTHFDPSTVRDVQIQKENMSDSDKTIESKLVKELSMI